MLLPKVRAREVKREHHSDHQGYTIHMAKEVKTVVMEAKENASIAELITSRESVRTLPDREERKVEVKVEVRVPNAIIAKGMDT